MGGDVGCCWVDDVVLKSSMSTDKQGGKKPYGVAIGFDTRK